MAEYTKTAERPQPCPPPNLQPAARARSLAATRRSVTTPVGSSNYRFAAMNLAGTVLLVWSVCWWAGCLSENRMAPVPVRWFDTYKTIGIDFEHNYRVANHWLDGGNPYVEPFGDPLNRKLCYPPIVIPLFSWCGLLDYASALRVWTIILASMVAAGVWSVCRGRPELGLSPVPILLAAALVFNCSPVIFALERGNYDILTLPLILVAVRCLRRESVRGDVLAGACLALAAAIKVYPGLIAIGLLPLRRYWSFAAAAVSAAAFAAYQPHNIEPFLANIRELAATQSGHLPKDFVHKATHSLTQAWPILWTGSRLEFLGRFPPLLAAAAVFGPLVTSIGYGVYRCPNTRPILLPYFLWLVSVATFIPGVSNDYNLVFLPLAAIAVWDGRDPVPVHIALGFALLWLQPLEFVIPFNLLFVFKLSAVLALAVCLDRRVRETAPAADSPTFDTRNIP